MKRKLPTIYNRGIFYFRRRRMDRFFTLFDLGPRSRVVDIGGSEGTWLHESGGRANFTVTMVNIRSYGRPDDDRIVSVEADATDLPFTDQSFDLVFSNSVIEHVGDWDKQKQFAREARRVGRRLWIQTPARSFPIEAHLLAPYVQYLPKPILRRIARWTPRGWMNPQVARGIVDEVRLLNYREVKELFPDCRILRERFLGFTKSYVAVRGEDGGAA